jgi:hypothetical protein
MPEAARSDQGYRARQKDKILENAAGLLLLTTILVFIVGGAWATESSSPHPRPM